MSEVGVVYVAYGNGALREARNSIRSVRDHTDLPITLITDECPQGVYASLQLRKDTSKGLPGRWAKVNLDRLSPYDDTLFLDADTAVHGDLSIGFRLLDAGFDLVAVASSKQGDFRLLSELERAVTLMEFEAPLEVNSGVMWFRKTERTRRLFDVWRAEWERWKHRDQGALARALHMCPVRLFLLGRPYNGGHIVIHRFGACRVG